MKPWMWVMVASWAWGCGSEVPSPPKTASPPPFPVNLTDVTDAAGIRWSHRSGGPEKTYILEAKGGGIGWLDYDGDGWLDLYLVNGATLDRNVPLYNALYRNNGDGTFTDVTTQAGVGDSLWGMGCAAADYDNDGDQDLLVTNYGRNRLYRNNGDGTFTDVARWAGVDDPRWSTGAAFVDYDQDGHLDLYMANYVAFDPHLDRERRRDFCQWKGVEVFCGPRSLPGAADVLYRNNGDGTFTDMTASAHVVDSGKYYGFAVLAGDYDNDGDADIYIANDSTPNLLYRNNGDGTFTDVAELAGVAYNQDGKGQAGMGAAFGDYDNDGWLDIVVTNFADDYNTLYHNGGNGFFSDATLGAGLGERSFHRVSWGTAFVDLDNDGNQDLFVATGHVYPQLEAHEVYGEPYFQPNQVFANQGNGRFEDVSAQLGETFQRPTVSRGAAFGDYDNDGDVDVVLLNLDGRPTLLRNNGGNGGHWLSVKLVGNRSNRDGIGARIEVYAGDARQIREIYAGSSFLSQNDLRAHFGFGDTATVDSLIVRWPGGLVDRMNTLPTDRFVVVHEGSSAISYQQSGHGN